MTFWLKILKDTWRAWYLQGSCTFISEALDKVVLGLSEKLLCFPSTVRQRHCSVSQVVKDCSKVFPTAINQNPTCNDGPMVSKEAKGQYREVMSPCTSPKLTFTVCEDFHPATEHGFKHCVLFSQCLHGGVVECPTDI